MKKSKEKELPGPSHFDKSLLTERLPLIALRIEAKRCTEFMDKLKPYLLNKPRMKNIDEDETQPPEERNTKLLLLSENIKSIALEGLPAELVEFVRSSGAVPVQRDLLLGYEYWSTDHVLKKLLPAGLEVPSSFETIGHIAHLNLRDQFLSYKHLIGQVIYEKNPHIYTVVNKLNSIHATFRTFDMEVIAGEQRLETEVKEGHATFRFNFAEVYWNSRLSTERDRVLRKVKRTDVICDMFCGVGPFAIRAAQVGCKTFANDLNPKCYEALVANIKLNKVQKNLHAFNMDAREFVRFLVHGDVAAQHPQLSGTKIRFNHVYMNLPADAMEFLDVFHGLFHGTDWTAEELPTIHCYCFSRQSEPMSELKERIKNQIQIELSTDPEVADVRDVAPNKTMLCVSFKLPAEAAFAQPSSRSMDMVMTNSDADSGVNQAQVESAIDNPTERPSKRQKSDASTV
eukprot:GILJ01004304.1.p1 GENE.GILJ01004304.1~~GILJ01004304.1.p1  ORF type:complete len:487 (+),score=83.35 GILJ01004304.1:91-1461(+)